MQRLTVDFGIDLGTTNSVIAVREGGRVAAIANKRGALTTPSAVYIDKRGQVYVGDPARDRILNSLEGHRNVAARFKRSMGQGTQAAKRFEASQTTMLPEELSAQILMSLRGDVRDKRGEEIRDIVVTVPADFDSGQCDATKRAAELAGFRSCTLLLEPIAAALAYGFDKLHEEAFWLVYDFGGGTFDAAIIQINDGVPIVVNHVGNNYLGGNEIDTALADTKLIPELVARYKLPIYDPATEYWHMLRAKLRACAEAAKIEVCRTKQPFKMFVEALCVDEAGQTVDFEATLTPEDVMGATAPFLAQTLELCRRAFSEKGLSPSDIDRVIMVGGSTLSPWIRDGVTAEFNRPLEVSIDPMTVVAEGAAVLASTIKLARPEAEEVPVGSYQLDIKSPLTVSESPADFSAILIPPAGGSVDGLTFEAIDEQSQWYTGKVAVRAGGRINVSLRMIDQTDTVFSVELRAADGTLLPCSPNRIPIHWGIGDFEIPLTHNIGVGMADNRMDVFLERGKSLPQKRHLSHRTTKPLSPNNSSEPLIIPIYEGSNIERANRNRLVWKLEIPGDKLLRSVPVGSEVVIYLSCDRSRTLSVKAEFPSVDLVVEAKVEFEKNMPVVDELRKGLEAQNERLQRLRSSVNQLGDDGAKSILQTIDALNFPYRIEECLRDPHDADARGNAERTLREFATSVDRLEDVISLPQQASEIKEALERARGHVERSKKPNERQWLEQIASNVERAIAARSPTGLRNCQSEISSLISNVLENDIGFWMGYFVYLERHNGVMKDSSVATMLFGQGHQAIERNDLDALKAVCRQLRGFLPDDEVVPQQIDPFSGPIGHTQRS